MSVRVRFAPSPTGLLHIGGARTALYCHLFAKNQGGKYILRMEDTDQERSSAASEAAILEDLSWLGLEHDEGPYRQSERLDIYRQFANTLMEEGKAYPCFLSQQELNQLSEQAEAEKLAPHTYHGKYRDFPQEEAKKKISAGEPYVVRFKNMQESFSFQDLVRGPVSFGPDMVGDFVILRSGGMPVYNFCCAVDDMLMEITHVIRAEEHLPNTLRQLMLYQALQHTPPTFAHVSLLVGDDGKKLSKREGASSVSHYRDRGYLPEALNNYLCLLGWSHPQEKDIFSSEEAAKVFSPQRFNNSPARYDEEKLKFFNGEHMRALSPDDLVEYIASSLREDDIFHRQSFAWKKRCLEVFKSKFNVPEELPELLQVLFSVEHDTGEEYKELSARESSKQIKKYLEAQVKQLKNCEFASGEDLERWQKEIKEKLGIKGKPLFKGIRAALTLAANGPDLKDIIPLTPLDILAKRLAS